MYYPKDRNMVIEVPKFPKGNNLFDLDSAYTLFVEKNKTIKVAGDDFKNINSFFFRTLAVSVASLMFLSPLSPFIGTLYADEGETASGIVEREVGLIESENTSEKSDEGQESVEEEGEQKNNKDL